VSKRTNRKNCGVIVLNIGRCGVNSPILPITNRPKSAKVQIPHLKFHNRLRELIKQFDVGISTPSKQRCYE